MYKPFALTAVMMATAFGFSTPTHAGNPVKVSSETPRVLRISKGICETSRQDMIGWARRIEGVGSYAVPRYPAGQQVKCDGSDSVLPIGYSWGYDTQAEADAAAMAACTARLPSGFDRCVVIGQSFDRTSR